MNIVFISHYTDLYGANKSLFEVIINLNKNYGINPIVITPGSGEFSTELNKNGIENYSFKYFQWVTDKNCKIIKKKLKWIRYKVINYITVKKIKKILSNRDIDLIHTNSSTLDIGAKIAEQLNIKHVWHFREFGEEDYNLINYNSINKVASFINNNCDKVIFISQALAKKYRNIIDSNKICLVYNGINRDSYYIKNNKDNFNEFNILFVGLISKSKNQIELLKAINILVNNKNKKEIKTYFLGDGDIEYINEMKVFCEKNKLLDNIFFEGKVSNIKEYIKKSHVGIVASKNEAFGRVTIEYMMGGMAVIVSNTGANPEIVTNGETGFIYRLGNVYELAEKIEYLYDNRKKIKEIAYNGQIHALNTFTSDINCKNIYNLYQEVLSN